jgi:alkanesulfonate monooxygenase SsuD/methylene tetrahydromethanopterin reductase-like flavin-dependent oxidoreductase (luciferase family)
MSTDAVLRQGFVIPGGSPDRIVELATQAEGAGWDGVFVSEIGYGVDPWTVLGAAAARTSRIRLGTMLTPLPWRRPWKLAGQVATLDQLSGGRAILGVGLGAVDDALGNFGEAIARRERAERLDEGLAIVNGLWSGERRFDGRHYDVDLTKAVVGDLRPTEPRPPIWCVAAWPSPRSLERIAHCAGIIPSVIADDGPRQATIEELPAIVQWIDENLDGPRDVVVEGESEPGRSSLLREWHAAGATWWLETRWMDSDDETVERRIAAGPAEVA